LAIVFTGAMLGLAPVAAAQNLALTVGSPVAYRVSLPEGWATRHDDETLTVFSEDENLAIMVAAKDILATMENPMPMPEPEARRILTAMLMSSDSLLLQMLQQTFQYQKEYPITGMTHEIGTLGGERSARLSGRMRIDGEDIWFQFHVTVKDGVMYMLCFLSQDEFSRKQEPLMDRVHASFVLADAPPPAGFRARGRRTPAHRELALTRKRDRRSQKAASAGPDGVGLASSLGR
jgi:hypothetical protein